MRALWNPAGRRRTCLELFRLRRRRRMNRPIWPYALSRSHTARASRSSRDFRWDLPAGDHLAVVGPSGIGKSTLAALLSGVLRPDGGAITVGGKPCFLRPDRPRLITMVPQEAYVFAGSLRENLVYLRPSATEEEITASARAVGLDRVLNRLGGLDAEVNLTKSGLSEGERQLVTLARSHLAASPIVVLDEATCHLDPAAEERAERAFMALGRTLIVVAHRMAREAGAGDGRQGHRRRQSRRTARPARAVRRLSWPVAAGVRKGENTRIRKGEKTSRRKDEKARRRVDEKTRIRRGEKTRIRRGENTRIREDEKTRRRRGENTRRREDEKTKRREDEKTKRREYENTRRREDEKARRREYENTRIRRGEKTRRREDEKARRRVDEKRRDEKTKRRKDEKARRRVDE